MLPELAHLDVDHGSSLPGMNEYKNRKLGPWVCPGRGQGIADIPSLKLVQDIHPNDVEQLGVGECSLHGWHEFSCIDHYFLSTNYISL